MLDSRCKHGTKLWMSQTSIEKPTDSSADLSPTRWNHRLASINLAPTRRLDCIQVCVLQDFIDSSHIYRPLERLNLPPCVTMDAPSVDRWFLYHTTCSASLLFNQQSQNQLWYLQFVWYDINLKNKKILLTLLTRADTILVHCPTETGLSCRSMQFVHINQI